MQAKGIVPFALGNDGRWPAMGTFDQLNFRMNGYQFHMDLMAGKESWTDDRVEERLHGVGEPAAVPPGEPQRANLGRGRQRLRQQESAA